MDKTIFESVIGELETVINDFSIKDWKERKLFDRFNEIFDMINSYDLPEEQKVYIFRKNVILLTVESVHDVFPAADYFRENPAERFLVFRTPGQEDKEGLINEWTDRQLGNWSRQGEVGISASEKKSAKTWWD